MTKSLHKSSKTHEKPFIFQTHKIKKTRYFCICLNYFGQTRVGRAVLGHLHTRMLGGEHTDLLVPEAHAVEILQGGLRLLRIREVDERAVLFVEKHLDAQHVAVDAEEREEGLGRRKRLVQIRDEEDGRARARRIHSTCIAHEACASCVC